MSKQRYNAKSSTVLLVIVLMTIFGWNFFAILQEVFVYIIELHVCTLESSTVSVRTIMEHCVTQFIFQDSVTLERTALPLVGVFIDLIAPRPIHTSVYCSVYLTFNIQLVQKEIVMSSISVAMYKVPEQVCIDITS
ncbi:hypothetical protein BgiBS90_025045 [Biomphalaria glabrata]|nr:hypothetical protein BgiBS90_025045 [Biomphalaria glabrata]